jgi:hypothetical protein
MARSILITIPDNAVADKLAYDIANAAHGGMPCLPQQTIIETIVARPTLWCKCTTTQRKRGRQKELGDYTAVPKFGWWVHALCQRPTKYIVDHWVENHLNGCVNLLPGIIRKTDARKAKARENRNEEQVQVGTQLSVST